MGGVNIVMEIRLSRNFVLSEFTRSVTAAKLGIPNTPTPEDIARLKQLCVSTLQPIRDAWGSGLKVTSGFRGFRLNKAVGGSDTGVHPLGWAADIVPANGRIKEFKAFVKFLLKKGHIPFDQCIDEKKGKSEWVHIGFANRKGLQRKQFLVQHR